MMIDATVAPKVGFASPFGTTVCNVNHINARPELLPEAGAQRTLEGVGCSGLIMYEASPSAYPSGMLVV
jgi:hypothetical protein